MSDLISRQAAIEWCLEGLNNMPSAQPEPSEMTDEQAILHLQSTGWMQNHDREMYESGLREQLADDSGGYDSLIPCEDTISRQDAIRWVKTECNPYGKPTLDFESGKWVIEHLKQMPSVQPVDKDINVSCKDAISRQGAIDICNNVIDMWQGQLGEGALVAIKNAINNLPSVQPDIIYCKDCKDYHKIPTGEVWTCRYFRRAVMGNDFCSYAERRTDGEIIPE